MLNSAAISAPASTTAWRQDRSRSGSSQAVCPRHRYRTAPACPPSSSTSTPARGTTDTLTRVPTIRSAALARPPSGATHQPLAQLGVHAHEFGDRRFACLAHGRADIRFDADVVAARAGLDFHRRLRL